MDLFCYENCNQDVGVLSKPDHVLLNDNRVLRNLLAIEHLWILKQSYFDNVQKRMIMPETRAILTTWMAEVCKDQQCEHVVLPMSITLLDRFLSIKQVPKGRLQLVGCACMLLASKLRQCHYVSAEQLIYYTDYSITAKQLLDCELEVLSALNWDVSAVTATDYVDYLLARLTPIQNFNQLNFRSKMLISICSTDFCFAFVKPSLTAIACLCVSAIAVGLSKDVIDNMRCTWNLLTGHAQESIEKCIDSVETTLSTKQLSMSVMKRSSTIGQTVNNKSTSANSANGTPTDVFDACNDRAF